MTARRRSLGHIFHRYGTSNAVLLTALIMAASAAVTEPAIGQEFEWTNAGDLDHWFDEDNWDPTGIPGDEPAGAGVTAIIPEGFGPVPFICCFGNTELGTINAQDTIQWESGGIEILNGAMLKDPAFAGSIIDAFGEVQITGSASWSGGRLGGSATYAFNGEQLTLGGPATESRILDNNATLEVNGPVTQHRTLSISNNASVTNNETWTLSAQNNSNDINGNGTRFDNLATFESAGANRDVDVPFDNSGTIRVLSGDLSLREGGTHSGGSYEIQSGSALFLTATTNAPGGVEITGSVSATGAGSLALDNTIISGTLSGQLSGSFGLWLAAGEIDVSGTLENTQHATWAGATLTGSGQFGNAVGATLDIVGGTLESTLLNAGTVEQFSDLNLENGTVINLGGAEWRFQEDENVNIDSASADDLFDNSGGVLLRQPSGITNLNAPYRQDFGGEIIVKGDASFTSPELDFHGGGEIIEGMIEVQTDAQARFFGGTYTLGASGAANGGGGPTFTGDGTFSVVGSTTVLTEGAATANMSDAGEGFVIDINSGGIGGAGVLTNDGLMTWEDGPIGVEFKGLPLGEITNNGTFRSTGSTNKNLRGSLNNNAEKNIVIESGFTIDGGVIFNEGEFRFEPSTFTDVLGANGAAIFNDGRIRVPADKDANLKGDLLLDNTGIVRVDANASLDIETCDANGCPEVVQLNDGCLEGGTWIVLESGSLSLPDDITKLGSGTEVELLGEFENLETLDQVEPDAKFLVGTNAQLSDSVQNLGLVRIDPPGVEQQSQLDVEGDINNEVDENTGIMGDMEHDLVIALNGSGEQFNGYICDNLNNNANVHPGGESEPGPFNVQGNFNQGATGVLNIDIAGFSPIDQHDQLDVEGNVMLAGTLDVQFINEFDPQIGDAFTIITASAPGGASNDTGPLITGTFENITGQGLWDVTYNDTNVIITYQGESPQGDIDNNGAVDVNDLLQLLSAWGACPGCPADLDNNGMVDVSDLLTLLGNWG